MKYCPDETAVLLVGLTTQVDNLETKFRGVRETVANLITADHRNTEELSSLLQKINNLDLRTQRHGQDCSECRRLLGEAAQISANFDAWLRKHDAVIVAMNTAFKDISGQFDWLADNT